MRQRPTARHRKGPAPWWLSLCLAVALASLASGSYALLQSTWLESRVAMETLHLLHIAWGMGVAFVLSAGLGWYYLRRSSALFSAQVAPPAELADRTRDYRRHALWFVQLRWLAVAVSGALSFLATHVLGLLARELFLPLAALVLALLVSNVAFLLWSQRSSNPYRVIVVQTVSDLVLLTLLLTASGGIENPLYAIYVFHVVIAAILLSSRHSYLVTTLAAVLLSAVALGEYSRILPHHAIQLTPHQHVQGLAPGREGTGPIGPPSGHGSAESHGGPLDREDPAGPDEHTAAAGIGDHVLHPTHDIAFVLGRLLPFLGILYCLTYLTQIVVLHLQRRERQLLRSLDERRLMESRLVQASKMAAIGELAGNVAHEVNNPVAVISGKARILLDEHLEQGDLPGDVLEGLRKIEMHAERIGKITSGLLAFSRPSLGKKEPLAINDVIRDTLVLVEDALKGTGIRLSLNLVPALPAVVGNSHELQQALLNVIANAVDAMTGGGVLRISTRRRPAAEGDTGTPCVAIHITDSGPGMPPEVAERVFEPFFTTKDEGRGTGLGLAITQGLIRSHSGRIGVRSAPGKGTTFSIVLPALGGSSGEAETPHAEVQGTDPRR